MVDTGKREDLLLEKIQELVIERDLAYFERDQALKDLDRYRIVVPVGKGNPANV